MVYGLENHKIMVKFTYIFPIIYIDKKWPYRKKLEREITEGS